MSETSYDILSEHTVASYVRRRPALAALLDADSLDVREVGDGNLNLVFVCRDDRGRSLVLKQSLPYVRVAGPSWPLTPDRSHAEARGLLAALDASPATSPQLFGYDREQHVLAMEDLSHLTVLRTALNEGAIVPGAVADCARHVARLVGRTGLITLSPSDHRAAASGSTNRALCAITEALVFREPFVDHHNNRFVDELGHRVRSLRADQAVRREVTRLETCFLERPEALIHGDLHTGSVMVGRDATGSHITKVIDPEFCFYGPVAFDLGTLLANVLFAAARAESLGRVEQHRWLRELPAELWRSFTDEFWTQWAERSDTSLTEAQAGAWLDQTAGDTMGFAGCEAVRRVVGFAKVTDLESLPPPGHLTAATLVLDIARRWLDTPAATPLCGRSWGFAAPEMG